MKYVIIGGGVAGTTAAAKIAEIDPKGEITMLTEESYPFYSRIRLIDYLAGEIEEKKLVIRDTGWHAENGIGLYLKTVAASIDVSKKIVLSSRGEVFSYDRLLISCGGASFVPPFPGADKKGVFTLRNIDDVKAIVDYAEGKNRVLLIGGGVLGLESGNALRKRGKSISVVEFFPRLLPRQMDPQVSGILKSQMEGMGFVFYLGAKTKEITGGDRVEAVLLEGGGEIKTDMVIISAGIRANTALAASAGMAIGKKGVIVDDAMMTSVESIYAAGDVTEHKGMSYGIWPAAEKQGETAGINMAGGSSMFTGITPSNILKVAGIDLVSAGNIDAEGRAENIVFAEKGKYIYKKLVIEDDRLTGCIMLGSLEGRRKILKAVEEKRNIKGIREDIKNWRLDAL